MRANNKGPRNGSMVWLMAVIIIACSAKMDSITADIALLALCGYAMHNHHRRP
ncbi:hypothetical protein BLEM_1241 [Bifidobacterium lemurum]|uniref:Lipoprotein n=1 Tax=Bifidobacterium lemurum TaxID=1603886 RepID=A0A261FRW9_9BIFI|nr:hypothetical protein BLEM_1241 [Bifidobacterium lemurum]